jgi:predicted O-linked N-acetylglucosamine transferase (SPINDLY family)
MEILRRVEHSALWLVDDNVWSSANFADAARNAGVDPARIVSASRTSPLEYLAYLDAADLFLDTYPYNAGTIASDAIRMHLPLVTLSGQSFASRMAGRLLTALGAQEGIAVSVDDYVEKAVALATDRNRYDAYKLRFTDDAWAATIGNIAKFTEQFERSLKSVVVRPPPAQYANDTMAGSDLAVRSADESEVAADVPVRQNVSEWKPID